MVRREKGLGLTLTDNLQRKMAKLGMSEDQSRPDYSACRLHVPFYPQIADILTVLTSEEACNMAIEYDLNPVVDDERSFDIYPEYVPGYYATFQH
jgi:translation initiation factor IF-2